MSKTIGIICFTIIFLTLIVGSTLLCVYKDWSGWTIFFAAVFASCIRLEVNDK